MRCESIRGEETRLNTIKTYNELSKLKTFDERFKYLKLDGAVGVETFGIERQLNQDFYKSQEWKSVRNKVIIRDNGNNLGIDGEEIPDGTPIYIHHMNPITISDIIECSEFLLNPEYLISTTHNTHNAIHYGDDNHLIVDHIAQREKNDTCPWRVDKEK